jgi:hypothetical protein
MIRQAISCDVCGTEKKQTNHWFVAREQSGELHLSGWGSRNRSRSGSKHLCGQTCLHKLVDDFIARTNAARAQPIATEAAASISTVERTASGAAGLSATDTSLTAARASRATQANARTSIAVDARSPLAPAAVAASIQMEPAIVPIVDAPPMYSRRTWRTEAWEREQRRAGRLEEITARRRP